jgi:hypothetical protein
MPGLERVGEMALDHFRKKGDLNPCRIARTPDSSIGYHCNRDEEAGGEVGKIRRI